MNEHVQSSITIDTLGRYKVIRHIAHGGMSDVWLGEDPRLHRQVAIKTLPVRQQQDQEFVQRFEREARAAAALNHPHILPIHDYGRQILADQSLILYIVMPFIKNGSLADAIAFYTDKHSLMPFSEALALLAQAAEAIDYAHEQQIVHRDIKPEHMLLREKDWLLLADFGIARVLTEKERLTVGNTGFGTATYMAPEQANNQAVGASDTYSLAVLAYQLFTGRLPFQADTNYAITIQHLTQSPPPPRQFNPQISPTREQVLLQGLAKKPEDRFPSASLFVSALRDSAVNQTSGASIFVNAPRDGSSGAVYQSTELINVKTEILSGVGAVAHETDRSTEVETQNQQNSLTRRRLILTGGAAVLLLAGGGLGTWKVISSHGTAPHVSTPPKATTRNPDLSVFTLTSFNYPAGTLNWSPQRHFLAAASGQDAWLITWDIDAFISQPGKAPMYKQRVNLPVGNSSPLEAWSSDGRYLAVVNNNSSFSGNRISIDLNIFNAQTVSLSQVTELPLSAENTISAFGWLQHNAYLITAEQYPGEPAIIRLTTAAQPQKQWKLTTFGGTLTSLAIAPDESTIAIGLVDRVLIGEVRFTGDTPAWYQLIPSLQEATSVPAYQVSLGAVVWSYDGNQIISASSATSNGGPAFWRWRESKPQPQPLNLPTASSAVSSSTLSPSAIVGNPASTGPGFATSYNNGSILVWNTVEGTEPSRTLDTMGITKPVVAMAWSHDGKWLAASFSDTNASILIWEL